MALRKTRDLSGENSYDWIYIHDLRRNNTRVYLGRLRELDSGEWQWESRYGFSRGREHGDLEALQMLVKIAGAKFRPGQDLSGIKIGA